jgi:hypothetical protein
VSGNLSIAALQVLDTQNISVQGKQTGLTPAAAISNMARNLVKNIKDGVPHVHKPLR